MSFRFLQKSTFFLMKIFPLSLIVTLILWVTKDLFYVDYNLILNYLFLIFLFLTFGSLFFIVILLLITYF